VYSPWSKQNNGGKVVCTDQDTVTRQYTSDGRKRGREKKRSSDRDVMYMRGSDAAETAGG
jgi:hypothetical protein